MKLALTKFKYYPSFSEETNAYEATVTIDGVPVFAASNRGIGGDDDYRPLEPKDVNRAKLREAEAYAKTLPPRPSMHNLPDLPMNLELLIGDLVTEKIIANDLAKKMKTKVLVLEDGKLFQYHHKAVSVDKMIEWVKQKKPNFPILNVMSFDEALAIYRKS